MFLSTRESDDRGIIISIHIKSEYKIDENSQNLERNICILQITMPR